MYYQQLDYNIRFEWGEHGVTALRSVTDLFIIVDVLSFTTSVEIASARGAFVLPYRFNDDSAAGYAKAQRALLAEERGRENSFTLAPSSLTEIPASTRLVLPSPNGATLTLRTHGIATVAGCLRNAQAVARYAQQTARRISVIAAGERWHDGTLRPCVEDLLGAGAIIDRISGRRSPEATLAAAAFQGTKHDLSSMLMNCASGRELCQRGYGADVKLAIQLNCSTCVPVLRDGAFVDAAEPEAAEP